MVKDNEIRIVRLEPMLVAVSHGFSTSPEALAWGKLFAWAERNGLWNDLSHTRFFGFNNPNPSPGSPNYGYEQWMTVPPGTQGDDEIQIKEIPAATYAVLHCRLKDIGTAWRDLVTWVEESGYPMAPLPCLEEALNPEIHLAAASLSEADFLENALFDLYEPILK